MGPIEDLKTLTTGIYVLTVRRDDVRHGMSSSWVTQISGEPPLLAAAVDRAHFSHAILEETGRFGLNVIGRRARHVEDFFYSPASRAANNLAGFPTVDAPSGIPLLSEALAGFDCAVEARMPAGDHTIFVARIEWLRRGEPDTPLTSLDLEYVYLGTGRIVKR